MRRLLLTLLTAAALTASAHAANWEVTESKDSFDGDVSVTATSPLVFGTPYRNSKLVARCTNGHQLEVYATYNYLNRRGDDSAPVQVRFYPNADLAQMAENPKEYHPLDKDPDVDLTRPETWGVSESTSGDALFFEHPYTFVSTLMESVRFATRFDYYGHGAVTINYELRGGKAALASVRNACLPILAGKRGKRKARYGIRSVWSGEYVTKTTKEFIPVLSPVPTFSEGIAACKSLNGRRSARGACNIALKYNPKHRGYYHF